MRADRLRGYFDVQLRFAAVAAPRADIPFIDAVLRYTNFHRRFGFGAPGNEEHAADWARYTERLSRLRTVEDAVNWTQAFYADCPDETLPAEEKPFGCFSCNAPTDDGVIRFHFYNSDSTGGAGPLSREKMAKRQSELSAMFAHIRKAHPDAKAVHGASWLYNTEAYTRLFPEEYIRSCTSPTRPIRLNGSSSWGQFLDYRGRTKAELRAAFLSNLDQLDLAEPWRVFPLPVLFAQAPIESFYAHYGITELA